MVTGEARKARDRQRRPRRRNRGPAVSGTGGAVGDQTPRRRKALAAARSGYCPDVSDVAPRIERAIAFSPVRVPRRSQQWAAQRATRTVNSFPSGTRLAHWEVAGRALSRHGRSMTPDSRVCPPRPSARSAAEARQPPRAPPMAPGRGAGRAQRRAGRDVRAQGGGGRSTPSAQLESKNPDKRGADRPALRRSAGGRERGRRMAAEMGRRLISRVGEHVSTSP